MTSYQEKFSVLQVWAVFITTTNITGRFQTSQSKKDSGLVHGRHVTSRHADMLYTWRSLHLCLWSLWKSCSFGDKVVKCKKLVCASSCFLAEALKKKKEKKSKTLFPDSFRRKILKQINPGQILSTFVSAPQRERERKKKSNFMIFLLLLP